MTPKAVILQGAAGMIVLTGAFVYSVGAVRVNVREKARDGEHIRLTVPAIVVPVGAMLVPKQKLRDIARDLQPWLPAIEAASEELRRCPDGPLVEVDSPHEHARIVKRGDSLVIDVDDAGETVHISCPLAVLGYTARQLVVEGPPA